MSVGQSRGSWPALMSAGTPLSHERRYMHVVGAPGLNLLGNVMQRFTSVVTTYEPVSDGLKEKSFISSSFDATSHFERDVDDLLSLYKRVTGKELDMNINADSVEADY